MRRLLTLCLVMLLAACAGAQGPTPGASSTTPRGPRVMVAAANPLAVEAGLKVLRAGGSAMDAAVAVQAVLALVEPQSSSLSGGAYMVYYDARTRQVTAYDGRETAPASADGQWFFGPDGKPMPFFTAITSGRSTGVPGAIAMLAMAQKDHGKLAWSSLFGDGVRLADNGFPVGRRLAGMAAAAPQARQPDANAYFTKPDGSRIQVGDTLTNAAYAATLRRVAAEGPSAILTGPIAQAIVNRVHEGAYPSTMTLTDLAGYKPLKAPALCRPYRVYVICTNNPASSGVALLEALKILERTDIATRGPNDPKAWMQLAEAERLMYADRGRYVGDPAFVPNLTAALLDPAFIAARAALIGDRAGPPPTYGALPQAAALGEDHTLEPSGTSHFVIVDAAGNVVSMTTTVESVFGSGRMVAGFFLNNQLTDFSFAPREADGAPAANAVAGGKRPRSSMSPVIILDRQGRFVAALGSPGGNSILAYNLKTIVALLDWHLTMQQAIDLPNLIAAGANFTGESAKFAPGVIPGLAALGVTLTRDGGEDSGVHGVMVRPWGLEGGADPRREGVARGY